MLSEAYLLRHFMLPLRFRRDADADIFFRRCADAFD